MQRGRAGVRASGLGSEGTPRGAGETEFRALTPAELRVCSAAAQAGGARLSGFAGEAAVVDELHRRGLLYFEVPIRPDDHVSIPPLEARTPLASSTPGGRGTVQAAAIHLGHALAGWRSKGITQAMVLLILGK